MEPRTNLSQEFAWLLDTAIAHKASDLHILSGSSPSIRVDSQLRALDIPAYTPDKANAIISAIIGRPRYEKMVANRQEIDFSFAHNALRIRANVYFVKDVLSISLRILSDKIPTLDELGVPPILAKLSEQNQGLIIIAGPTGHGKSTTLAALVNKIAHERRGHIITIEDPIEYNFEQGRSLISQREVGSDTPTFDTALRAALREDPDVVMVGEMRDLETVEAALHMAETGHLVLTSLHTNSAAQTADRVVGIFPPHQQNQIRQQLSETLLGIFSQRLLPKVQGGRIMAAEVLVANPAVRSLIREGKTFQLPNLIQTAASEGMASMEKSLAEMVSKGEVTIDDAMSWAIDPKNLKMLIY